MTDPHAPQIEASTSTMLTEIAFAEGMSDALSLNRSQLGGETIDVAVAWAAYESDAERFHRVTEDNPEGDPFAALILSDGPWWVKA